MTTRTTTGALVAASALLAGCAAQPARPTAAQMLDGAHARLARDGLTEANDWLHGAESAACSDGERRTCELLRAEIELRDGRAGDVAVRLERMLVDDPDDPRAREVAGKARLVLADFDAASAHLERAWRLYRDDADVARAANLLALSDGCNAYAHGRLQLARSMWARISDPGLRAEVVAASEMVAEQRPRHESVAWNQP